MFPVAIQNKPFYGSIVVATFGLGLSSLLIGSLNWMTIDEHDYMPGNASATIDWNDEPKCNPIVFGYNGHSITLLIWGIGALITSCLGGIYMCLDENENGAKVIASVASGFARVNNGIFGLLAFIVWAHLVFNEVDNPPIDVTPAELEQGADTVYCLPSKVNMLAVVGFTSMVMLFIGTFAKTFAVQGGGPKFGREAQLLSTQRVPRRGGALS